MDIAEKISEDAIFRIGKVVAVDGRVIKVKVDKTKNTSHLVFKGELLRNISVGGYIKIVKGFTRIVGKVEGEFISEDKLLEKKYYGSEKEKIIRILGISLLGFFKDSTFERGIKELQLIDNECFLLHKREFDQVHNFISKNDDPLTIGTLALEKGQEIQIGVNCLFASHIGIFGNTGSGKSYTLAKIYRELFQKYKNSKKFKARAEFFLIDFNGEYIGPTAARDSIIVDRKFKKTFRLSTRRDDGDKFPITIEALNDPDFWVVFLEATEKTQTPFLRRALTNDFLKRRLVNEAVFKEHIGYLIFTATTKGERSLDKGVVTDLLNELSKCLPGANTIRDLLSDYEQHLQFHSQQGKFYYDTNGRQIFSDNTQYKSQVIDAKITQLQIDMSRLTAIDEARLRILIQYYDDIIRGFANREHLAPIIKRLDKRFDDLKKVITITALPTPRRKTNITIVSLKDVNIQMRKILPLLFCKMLYNDKKTRGDDRHYLNLIIDEAHNILSESSERESEQWKDYRLETFEEIIKEGRKFGVFLTIASQRPSDISPTIISQLHNYFVHRLINNEDIRAVEKTISYLDKVSFEYLPILPTGTCIVAGLLANIPVVVDIGKIEPDKHEPRNKTMSLTDNWH